MQDSGNCRGQVVSANLCEARVVSFGNRNFLFMKQSVDSFLESWEPLSLSLACETCVNKLLRKAKVLSARNRAGVQTSASHKRKLVVSMQASCGRDAISSNKPDAKRS